VVYEDIIWFALHNVASVSHNHDVAVALHFAVALRAVALDGVPGEEVLVAGIALWKTAVNRIRKRAENCQPKSGKDKNALQCYSCYSSKKDYIKSKIKPIFIYIIIYINIEVILRYEKASREL